jgi:GxxExxY protein
MSKLIYSEKSYAIIGASMEVHRILGPGLLEIIYKDALEYEFNQRGIPYEREKQYKVAYKDIILPRCFIADFVVYGDIILEVKAISRISDEFIRQTLNYMALGKCPLGLIANFGASSFQHKRFVR